MATTRYRSNLPQLDPRARMLTDGGVETDLIFHHGADLPHFAAFDLLRSKVGTDLLLAYYEENARVAARAGLAFGIDTPTWRASPDWTCRLGYTDDDFVAINQAGVRLAEKIRSRHETAASPMPISGVIGPRGDGYRVDVRQTAQEAADYHGRQVAIFADTAADYIAALTLTYSEEAIGVTVAARDAGMPVVISFTVETDGALVSGEVLEDAIATVDRATAGYVAYYMVNCAHPEHLPGGLLSSAPWTTRVRGIRANASRLSHAELDEAEQLDEGDPVELAAQLGELSERMPQLTVFGGCCGTDARHIDAIATALTRDSRA